MSNRPWTCPFCQLPQIASDKTICGDAVLINKIPSKYGDLFLSIEAIGCVNPKCSEVEITSKIRPVQNYHHLPTRKFDEVMETWQLRPAPRGKPQPSYIPDPIVADYSEACAIRLLSPKASATLARRCLQGMIRDFCNIKRSRLVDEITALSDAVAAGTSPQGVHSDVIAAIDGLRKIGNIGAHMEADINVIIDVDPNEALLLIQLIEMLFEEWYVARETRSARIAAIKAASEGKSLQKKPAQLPADQ